MKKSRTVLSLDCVSAACGQLVGKRCWNVNSGGAAGSTIQLAFGERVLRTTPLTNPSLTEEYRRHDGELNLLVWCSYRLTVRGSLIASDRMSGDIVRNALAGAVLHSAPALVDVLADRDLVVQFENDATLHVFSNCWNSRDQAGVADHWEIWSAGRGMFASTNEFYME